MKIILVVEDKKEEREKAKEVVVASGNKVVIAEDLEDANRLWKNLGEKIDGIITDLHFPENSYDSRGNPNGLVIITHALLKNVPVSVCSDVDHHFAQYLSGVIADLEQISGKRIPFTMDSKNWQQAFENLNSILTEG